MQQLKPNIRVAHQKGLYYLIGDDNRLVRFHPWLADGFSFLYDLIMQKSVFPRKFGADIHKHYEILSQAMADIHGKRVLELAAGSGSAVHFLSRDNLYTGTDISPGLLRQAAQRFKEAGFHNPEFYVVGAEDLPFQYGSFDLCLCILSLNFFQDAEAAIREARRVLASDGILIGSVPVPERNHRQSTIRGTLYSAAELETICRAQGFEFEPVPGENGALFYFKAVCGASDD